MMKSRSISVFEEYVQSEKTREQYLFHLNKFAEYCNLESIDGILKFENNDLKEKIEDYVILFKNQGKSPNYIRIITFAIQSFCDSNDKMGINWKKIRKLLGKKHKPKKSRPYTTEEIKRMLHSTKDLRSKALILFLSASGVRRGAIPELKIKHLKQMSNDCLAVTIYEGSNEEYLTFINKESCDALNLYLERRKHDGEHLDPEHPVFRAKYQLAIASPKPFSEKSVSNMILRAKRNAGVDLDDSPNLLVHAFRRRFNTIMKLNENANVPLIERLMGHDMKLDNSYFQPTLDDLFAEYQKGISNLMIDSSERILAEKQKVDKEKTELQSKLDKQRDTVREQVVDILNDKLKEMRATGYLPK